LSLNSGVHVIIWGGICIFLVYLTGYADPTRLNTIISGFFCTAGKCDGQSPSTQRSLRLIYGSLLSQRYVRGENLTSQSMAVVMFTLSMFTFQEEPVKVILALLSLFIDHVCASAVIMNLAISSCVL
jgi:hypothetical protein